RLPLLALRTSAACLRYVRKDQKPKLARLTGVRWTLTAAMRASDPRHVKIRDEELLALDLVSRDCVLALSRYQPINEGLAQVRLHMRVIGGIHQYHVILVKQALVALNDDIKFAAVLKRDPGAAIRKHISVGSGGDVEGGLHAPTDLLAPMTLVFRDV